MIEMNYPEDAIRLVAYDASDDHDDAYKEILSRYSPRVLHENPDVQSLVSSLIGVSSWLVDAIALATATNREQVVDGLLLDLTLAGLEDETA